MSSEHQSPAREGAFKAVLERVRLECEAQKASVLQRDNHPTLSPTNHKMWRSGVYVQAQRIIDIITAHCPGCGQPWDSLPPGHSVAYPLDGGAPICDDAARRVSPEESING